MPTIRLLAVKLDEGCADLHTEESLNAAWEGLSHPELSFLPPVALQQH